MSAGPLGVGIGYRSEIRREIVRHSAELDFLEVIGDSFFEKLDALRALRSLVPCVPHTLALSVGSTVRDEYLENVARVVDAVDPPFFTDHLAFTHVDGEEAGHLVPVARTRESLDVVARNVRRVQERVGRPFAVENITAPFAWPQDEMSEGEFLSALVARTGCRILLDLENVRVNAANLGADPARLLDELPLESVVQVHVAGGTHGGGLEHDSHSEPVSAQTWRLLEEVVERGMRPAVLIERDQNFPPMRELLEEVRIARGIVGGIPA